jgi:phosphoglycerate-specific signal transduction histidine kinase
VLRSRSQRDLCFYKQVNFKVSTFNFRFALKQEEEKRRSADQLSEKTSEQLRRKGEQCQSEVEARQQLEASLRTLEMELKTVKSHLNQVCQSLVKVSLLPSFVVILMLL